MRRSFWDKILWQRVEDYLKKYQPKIIGVAGGFDKTLTRLAITRVLDKKYRVRSVDTETADSREIISALLGGKTNRRLTWWRLLVGSRIKEIQEAEPDIIVLETAVNNPGDMDTLAQTLSFNGAVVLNATSAHLDVFVEKANVAHELLSLPISISPQGVTVLSTDDPLVMGMKQHLKSRVVTFGKDPQADIRVIRADRLGLSGFAGELAHGPKRYEWSFPHLAARHQVDSMLAAIAMGVAYGVEISHALKVLRDINAPNGHVTLLPGKNNAVILDDTHDASYESMQASLKALASMPSYLPRTNQGSVRRIAILGDIAGLGIHTKAGHASIGQAVAQSCDMFVGVGEEMRAAQAVVLQKGGIDTHHFTNSRDVGKWLTQYLKPHDIVLIKGAREMNMGEVVKALSK